MKEITSLEKYISAVMSMKQEQDALGLGDYQWFFRGQSNAAWPVIPNVFRGDKLNSEYTMIQNAIRQNPFEFRTLTEFETLTKLQHYGLGTRLLDVTLNPLVALYFATAPKVEYQPGKDKRFKQEERDGAIFYKHSPWHSVNELCVRIAMTLPFIQIDETMTVEALLTDLSHNKVIDDSEYGLLSENDYSLFIEYIQKSYFIVSTHSNERLIRQSGAFVLPTALRIQNEDLSVGDRHVQKSYMSLNGEFAENYFIVPSKYKAQIREDLDFFNINEATMFPELEHQMEYLQQKKLSSRTGVPEFEAFIHTADAPSVPEYNDIEPDVRKVIYSVIPNISEDFLDQLEADITTQIGFVDWKSKQSIRSSIRRSLLRAFQPRYNAVQSKLYSDKITERLLNPADDMAKESE